MAFAHKSDGAVYLATAGAAEEQRRRDQILVPWRGCGKTQVFATTCGCDMNRIRLRIVTLGRAAGVAAMLSIVSAPGIRAQAMGSDVHPTFEIATIKPNKSGVESNSIVYGPAGMNCTNVTLKACLRAAYDLQEYQIVGPSWLSSERYNIVANAPGRATRDQLCRMLQVLLTERFKMKTHRESKDLSVYELVASKNGPKHLNEPAADAQPRRQLTNGSLVFQNFPISMFTEYLQRLSVIGRPVLDGTGLKGNYDFSLSLIEGSRDLKGHRGKAAMNQALERGIFTMVKEQLGLQLVPRKSVIDLRVIDQAERVPTEN